MIDGEDYSLRELSGFAVECVQNFGDETAAQQLRQGFALIALSLAGDNGPKYTPDSIDEGIDYVLSLPARVSKQLTEAVTLLNNEDMDDARKN